MLAYRKYLSFLCIQLAFIVSDSCEKVRLSRPMRPPDFDPPPNPTVTPTILQARWIFADRMGDEEVGPDLVQCQLLDQNEIACKSDCAGFGGGGGSGYRLGRVGRVFLHHTIPNLKQICKKKKYLET